MRYKKLHYLYYFFFPPTDRIWPDAVAGLDDNLREYHVSYTLRNFWAYLKSQHSLKRRFEFQFGYIPQKGWAIGAIAFDAASAAQTGNNQSWSHTCTGSNLVLILTHMTGNTADLSSPTYNSVGLTQDVALNSTINGSRQQIWHLLNPSTGANTLAAGNGVNGGRGQSASYTGVKQSGFPDATGQSTTDQSRVGAGDITYTITVVASGCWVVQTNEDNVLNPTGGVLAATRRGGETVWGSGRLNDSNGTVSTGAQSVGYSYSGDNSMTGVAISFAPAVAATFMSKIVII